MAKYSEIREWVRRNFGFVAQSCWIAHCKELNRIPVKIRYKGKRKKPCPPNKRQAIEDAFRSFGMI